LKHRIFSLATVLMAGCAIAISSCKEDITIHSDLSPSSIGTDTLIIPDSCFEAQTVLDDTLLTSTKSVSYAVYHALGWLKEPLDPSTNPYPSNTAGHIYLQVVPISTGFGYNSNSIIDSAVIVLPYGGFTWGDTTVNDLQEITAYELSDTLSNNSRYYTTTKKSFDPTPVSDPARFYTGRAGTGVINDSVTIRNVNNHTNTVKVAPHIRIPLRQSFVTRFNDIVARRYSTYDSFLNAFKGFYLEPSKTLNGRAMPYFRINGTSDAYGQANLLVYGHPSGLNDSVTLYQFPFNTTYAAHYNYITRAYSNMSLFNNMNHPYLMVQNQPGAAIDLKIKNLRSFDAVKGNVVINKVELILTEVNEFAGSTSYTHPPRIYPIGIDGAGVRYGIVDRYDNYPTRTTTENGLNFIDGTPVTNTTNNSTTYSINFPREFQQNIIQQKSELHLRINGTQSYPAAFRLIAGNRNNPNANYRYAVRVIYSKQK
jgi:hypothetical protein